jgi:putative addiction module component (TIGR02574 family)
MFYYLENIEVIMQKEELLKEIFELSPVDKASIVDRILTSFEFSNNNEIEKAWIEEAENRIDNYKLGKIKAVPAELVFSNINNLNFQK